MGISSLGLAAAMMDMALIGDLAAAMFRLSYNDLKQRACDA
jgi:hypothetical protein